MVKFDQQRVILGGMAERSKAAVLKTAVGFAPTGGSNPSPSARFADRQRMLSDADQQPTTDGEVPELVEWGRLLSGCRGLKPRPRVRIPPSPLTLSCKS